MKSVFIDTNVIIDFLADRKPYADSAAILFQLAKDGRIAAHISAMSINNTYYILKKVASHNVAIKLLEELENWVKIEDLSSDIIRKAMKSNFSDFEDALQYFSALNVGQQASNANGIDFIVTRDLKDFKKSELPVLSPETAVKLLLA